MKFADVKKALQFYYTNCRAGKELEKRLPLFHVQIAKIREVHHVDYFISINKFLIACP